MVMYKNFYGFRTYQEVVLKAGTTDMRENLRQVDTKHGDSYPCYWVHLDSQWSVHYLVLESP